MENQNISPDVISPRLFRKGSLRKSSGPTFYSQIEVGQSKRRPTDYLLVLLFLGISKKFDNKQILKKNQFEEEDKQKLLRNTHDRMTMAIDPIRKQVKDLNITSKFFKALDQQCLKYLHHGANLPLTRQNKWANKQQSISEGITKTPQQNLILSKKNSIEKCRSFERSCFISIKKQQKKVKIMCHKRISSDLRVTGFERRGNRASQISQSSTQKENFFKKTLDSSVISNSFQINRFKDKENCVKTISNCYNQTQYSPKSVYSLFQIFLQGIHKANYMLNIFRSKEMDTPANIPSRKFSQHTVSSVSSTQFSKEIAELSCKFTQILQICNKINIKINEDGVFVKNSKQKPAFPTCQYTSKFKPYFFLSDSLISALRSLLNSIYFQKAIENNKHQVKFLVKLIYDTRFSLKYLEKQIQNKFFLKKSEPLMSKWEKAFKNKFLPKKLYI